MNKIKSETEKSKLLRAMALEREKFIATQHRLEQQRLRSRGVSPTEGMLLNGLFSLATGGRFPALLKKPVQAIALSWLKGRFNRLVNKSLAQDKPQAQRMLFADETIDAMDAAAGAGAVDSVSPVQLKAVNDLRRVSNDLNTAIQEGRAADIESLSVVLRAQIAETRAVLEAAAAESRTPVDRALAWARANAYTRPWAAVGTGAGAGYAVGAALALYKRWQAKRQARRDFQMHYQQTAPRYRAPPRRG